MRPGLRLYGEWNDETSLKSEQYLGTGRNGEHYDPYALYGRLPMPGRGFPPYPMQQQQKMYIEDWD
ncbi:hypothetical protein MSG28_011205 [Choristoneura fumiferana]|uniref:Uncharacterized protein n=1 Tax=Choristoneura fumiferana TaxID=7141 RepID=A0ACC0KRT0_CHOFU|nr:hypothetical protein MSG28_011205 [Choristoneura fumiferana]